MNQYDEKRKNDKNCIIYDHGMKGVIVVIKMNTALSQEG